jgi:hypothetical protein
MTPEEVTRLATLEAEMKDVRDDVREIKSSLKALETIAASGNGALRTAFLVGGVIGWFAMIAVAIIGLFKH